MSTVEEGLGSALRRATGAKSTLGAIGAAAVTIGATTAAGALVGGSTFAGPGAVIAGTYAAGTLLNRMRKRRKMDEAAIQEYFENWESLHEGRSLTGRLIRSGIRSLLKPSKSSRRQAKPVRNTLKPKNKEFVVPDPGNDEGVNKPVATKQYRDPKTNRITPRYWGHGNDGPSVTMKDIIAKKNAAAGAAHHAANYTPQAKAQQRDRLVGFLKANPQVGEIMDIKSKIKSGVWKKPDWMKESVLSDWYKNKKRKEALSGKLNDQAKTKELVSRTYAGVAKKAYSDDFKKTATDISAKHGKRADQLNRRLGAINKPKSLNYMGNK